VLSNGSDVVLIDGDALFLALLTPVGGNIAKQRSIGVIRRNIFGRMRKEQIFREFALVRGNRSKTFDFLRIDDGQV